MAVAKASVAVDWSFTTPSVHDRRPVRRRAARGTSPERGRLNVVASDFDPELHLRLTGERTLLEPQQRQNPGPWDTPLLEVAAALVAVGALDEQRAQGIVDDYHLALGLRARGNGGFRRPRHLQRQSRQALKAPRVVSCEQSIEQPWGKLHVHYVALGDRATTVFVTASSPDGLAPFVGSGLGPTRRRRQPSITDNRGHTENAHISGGGRAEGGFRGRLTTMRPLAQDTKWLDIGPIRVDLVGESDPPLVEIEQLPDRDPAECYLWGRLCAGRHGPHLPGRPVSIEAGIETLIAAGALVPDNPAIDEIRDVLAAFTGQQPQGVIPQPWAGLLAGLGRQGGPSGIVALGVVTPVFDDVIISFEALIVMDGNFELHLSMSPDLVATRAPMSSWITGPAIEWWAQDNLDNWHLGAVGNWGSGPDIGEGTVTYWPALDPLATQLRIMPTGLHERAVITIDLPSWEERK
jgi:hypothetical protein